MKVKAGKGLAFWCQGKKVSDSIEISVQKDHDISCKLASGSLVEIKTKKEAK